MSDRTTKPIEQGRRKSYDKNAIIGGVVLLILGLFILTAGSITSYAFRNPSLYGYEPFVVFLTVTVVGGGICTGLGVWLIIRGGRSGSPQPPDEPGEE